MITKKLLKEENKQLKKELEKANEEIYYLRDRLNRPISVNHNNDIDLNMKYLLLCTKYNKLLDSCLSKETEHITYNGDLYAIKSIDYHKEAESVETINIEAVQVPREKGLINNLGEAFRETAKELNKIFFGNENN